MREAKVMQIFESTDQIQRLAIARALDHGDDAGLTVVKR
jgi:alkylation response protein AidB-like acyl-CoA dehydrogenase